MTDFHAADLAALIDRLPMPRAHHGGLAFSVASVAGLAPARIGKSIEGDAVVLFPSSEPSARRPPVELRHLSVLFGARCRVFGDTEEEAFFTVVRCHGDTAVQTYFLHMAKGLLSVLGPNAREAQVEQAVQAFVELFRAATKPPAYALRGLWGELLLIARCTDPIAVFRAWHVTGDERFDFGQGHQRVEVKTSGRSSRAHHFSLDQLTAVGVDVCLVSIQVEPSAAGRSLLELVDDISSKLTSVDDAMRLHVTVGAVLGIDWTDYATARFDDSLSSSSIRFYKIEDVPRIQVPLPKAVTQVHFVSDLAASNSMAVADLNAAGGLWAAAVPLHDQNP